MHSCFLLNEWEYYDVEMQKISGSFIYSCKFTGAIWSSWAFKIP